MDSLSVSVMFNSYVIPYATILKSWDGKALRLHEASHHADLRKRSSRGLFTRLMGLIT